MFHMYERGFSVSDLERSLIITNVLIEAVIMLFGLLDMECSSVSIVKSSLDRQLSA